MASNKITVLKNLGKNVDGFYNNKQSWFWIAQQERTLYSQEYDCFCQADKNINKPNVTIKFQKLIICSRLYMQSRLHAMCELLTLGFVGILLDMKWEKEIVPLIVWEWIKIGIPVPKKNWEIYWNVTTSMQFSKCSTYLNFLARFVQENLL